MLINCPHKNNDVRSSLKKRKVIFFVQIFHPKCKNKPTILHHIEEIRPQTTATQHILHIQKPKYEPIISNEKRVATKYDVLVDVKFEPHIDHLSIPLFSPRESCNCY